MDVGLLPLIVRHFRHGHCHGCGRYTSQELLPGGLECTHCGFVNAKLHEAAERPSPAGRPHDYLACLDCGEIHLQ